MRHGEKKLFRRGIALLLSLSLALGCGGTGGHYVLYEYD